MENILDEKAVDLLVTNSLAEDIKDGDITTRNIFLENKNARAEVIARESIILCGLKIFQEIFKLKKPELNLALVFYVFVFTELLSLESFDQG